MDEKKILIAVPCMDMVSARFAQSLTTLKKVGKCTVSFLIGSLIYDSRNRLAGICQVFTSAEGIRSPLCFSPSWK